jgi:EAL domain-containing protein (putative c-di-GMP-specific phosphodiesterase class I)
VTRRVIEWHRAKAAGRSMRYFINAAWQTIADARFTTFVREQLSANALRGGILCFELPESELLAQGEAIGQGAAALRKLGCRMSIGSVGRQSVSFKAIQAVAPDYVKLDGALVRELHRDPVAHAKARAINRVCQSAKMHTIAEFVEEEATLRRLREIGVDYVQGFGVARPGPLADLERR